MKKPQGNKTEPNEKRTNRKMGKKPIKIPNTKKNIKFAYYLAAHGATNSKLAELFGIGLTTLNKWLNGNSKFAHAIKVGRNESCQRVIDSVYLRACGYKYTEELEKPEQLLTKEGEPVVDSDGKPIERMRLVSRRHKHQPADIPAAKFYLHNRTKMLPPEERWTDKQHFDHTSSDGSMTPREAIKSGMSQKEAMDLYTRMIKRTQIGRK